MIDQHSDFQSQTSSYKRPRVLALSSGGGHWVQLLRIRPAFSNCDITYATVSQDYESEVQGARFHTIVDSSFNRKHLLIPSLLSIAWHILKVRPNTIISTGAAPGIIALFIGKLIGCKTIWIDSFANTNQLSTSGTLARYCSDLYLTQWPNLAMKTGPHYLGNLLCYS